MSGFGAGNTMIDLYVILAMPFNSFLVVVIYIIEIPSFYSGNATHMILVVYVIPCILSYDFNKLTILYIHVHISLSFL